MTGCNEAFIIDSEKRQEILNNCIDEDERKRTDELIRPILRGRDIKRYAYEWANLYLIATFPSRHYDIEQYPAVKKHFLTFDRDRLKKAGYIDLLSEDNLHQFCRGRLEQSGRDILVNGKKIFIDGKVQKSRKRTGNKWFETQDQIGYWDDFSMQKIVWAELARTGNAFALDYSGCFVSNTGYILVSNKNDPRLYNWFLMFLNSRAILFYLDSICNRFDETGWRWLNQHVQILPIPEMPNNWSQDICSSDEEKSDSLVSQVFQLDAKEREFLLSRFQRDILS